MALSKDALIISYDPFSCDRDSNITLFSDRMVIARKPHGCVICSGSIKAGERIRARRERNNDDQVVMTFYFCPECCEAMAESWTDGGTAIEARTALGMTAAKAEANA